MEIVVCFLVFWFFQKDVHRFTNLFASPEMSVRVDFDGKPSIYFLPNIGYVVYAVYVVYGVLTVEIPSSQDLPKIVPRSRGGATFIKHP